MEDVLGKSVDPVYKQTEIKIENLVATVRQYLLSRGEKLKN